MTYTSERAHRYAGTKFDKPRASQDTQHTCAKCNGTGRFITYTGRDYGVCFACQGSGKYQVHGYTPKSDSVEVNVDALTAAFTQAGDALKFPKLHLGNIRVSKAPANGKNAGALYVKMDGEYLGKVVDGRMMFSNRVDSTVDRQRVLDVLTNPFEAAIEHGKLTGNCACCQRALTDPKSVARGIGPVCAKRWFV